MGAKDAAVHGYVRELLADVLGVAPDDIDDAELLSHYGLNSVDLIDVIVKLESTYGIQFEPEAMENLTCRSLSENVLVSLAAADVCEPRLQ